MQSFRWGRRSLQELSTCSPGIRSMCNRMLSYRIMDVTIICGHRNEENQTEAFDKKLTKLAWPMSKHNQTPSKAVDIYPYHPRFKLLTGHPSQVRDIATEMHWTTNHASNFITCEYHRMAGLMSAAAKAEGVGLRWGGGWDSDGDGDVTDQTFMDLCHFEET